MTKRSNWGSPMAVLALGIAVGWTLVNVGVGSARAGGEARNRDSVRQVPSGGGGFGGDAGNGGLGGSGGFGGSFAGSAGTFTGGASGLR
jgi:hypothetical protein